MACHGNVARATSVDREAHSSFHFLRCHGFAPNSSGIFNASAFESQSRTGSYASELHWATPQLPAQRVNDRGRLTAISAGCDHEYNYAARVPRRDLAADWPDTRRSRFVRGARRNIIRGHPGSDAATRLVVLVTATVGAAVLHPPTRRRFPRQFVATLAPRSPWLAGSPK